MSPSLCWHAELPWCMLGCWRRFVPAVNQKAWRRLTSLWSFNNNLIINLISSSRFYTWNQSCFQLVSVLLLHFSFFWHPRKGAWLSRGERGWSQAEIPSPPPKTSCSEQRCKDKVDKRPLYCTLIIFLSIHRHVLQTSENCLSKL